jgi:hypothetical protein
MVTERVMIPSVHNAPNVCFAYHYLLHTLTFLTSITLNVTFDEMLPSLSLPR